MSRPTQIKSQPANDRLLREAAEAWGQQDYQQSIRLIEQASRKEPFNPGLLLELARAYGLRYDFPAAERHLEQAVQVSSARANTLADAGRICLEFGHVDMAIRYLEKASRKKGVPIGALMTLSDIYIRDARVDDATNLIACAAQIDRKDPRVQLEEAALLRLQGESDKSESLLRSLLSKPDVGFPVQVRGFDELAGILDRAGRYDEAMSVLLEVKAIQRSQAAPYAATLRLMQERGTEMERTITADVLARWRADAAKLHPPRRIALLCGHPRAGTTLLEQVLDAHGDITTAEETKIMHDEGVPAADSRFSGRDRHPRNAGRGPAQLALPRARELFPLHRVVHPEANWRTATRGQEPGAQPAGPDGGARFPEAKFLVAVRDPRDVVMSCFLQGLPLTPISSAYLSLKGTVRQDAPSAMGFWLICSRAWGINGYMCATKS